MSRSKSEIDAAIQLDSIGAVMIPSKDYIETQVIRGKDILTSSAGISRVAVAKDYENYIFVLSFDFDKLTSLNSAIGRVYAELSSMDYPFAGTFTFMDKTFERRMDRQSKVIFNKLHGKNSRITEQATYTAIYRFEGNVTQVSNPDARVSGSGKAVMLKYNVQDIASDRKSLYNKVTFK